MVVQKVSLQKQTTFKEQPHAEPARLEPVPRDGRGRDREMPAHRDEERSPHRDEEWPPLAATGESPRTNRRPNTAINK